MQNFKNFHLSCMLSQGAIGKRIPQGSKPRKRSHKIEDRGDLLQKAGKQNPWVDGTGRFQAVLQTATSQNWSSVTQETDMTMASSGCCLPLFITR